MPYYRKCPNCGWQDPVAWLLSAVWKIKPFPVKGQLRFFEVPYSEVA